MIHEQSPLAYFDDVAQRVVVGARQRANERNSPVVAPEHMLLALFGVRSGVAADVVAGRAGSRGRAYRTLAETLPPGQEPSPTHLEFTAACEAAIVRAAQQAKLLGADRVGPQHLLLGTLQTADDATVRAMSELGLTYDAVRADITRRQ